MPEAAARGPAEPFRVAELVALSLEGFLAVAALHLGEARSDGLAIETPEPVQAWMALSCATALLDRLAPMMQDGALMHYRAGVARLMKRLAELTEEGPEVMGAAADEEDLEAIASQVLADLDSSSQD